MTDLRAENEMLQERVAALEKALGDGFRAPEDWRLTRSENVIMGVLVAREIATRDAVHAALTLLRHRDDVEPKCIDVLMSKMRRKLPADVVIHTDKGVGWHLDHAVRMALRRGDARSALRAAIAEEAAAIEAMSRNLNATLGTLRDAHHQVAVVVTAADRLLRTNEQFVASARAAAEQAARALDAARGQP